jgi:hypothetical protein
MAADDQQQDMAQYAQIYSLKIPAGIKRDGTQFANNIFTDGVWCRFQRGEPKKMGGFNTLFNSLSGIYRGMVNIPYNGVNYVFAGNAPGLDVFTTGLTYGGGSGPYVENMLPGSVFANVTSNTASQVVVPGDATVTFAIGTEFIIEQTGTPVVYTITGSTYAAGPPSQTTIDFTPNAPAGDILKIWLNDTIFTPDSRNNWQFDAQFSPFGKTLNVIAHPGKNLGNIDSGVLSQVLVGDVFPDANNQFSMTGLCDSTGQDPTYKPIVADGGVCVLYPFIFVYGSHGFIANNSV